MHSAGFDSGMREKIADTERCARHEPGFSPRQESKIDGMKAIDVLARSHALDDWALGDVGR